MPRVVIDTNVIISSIFWEKGNPHSVIKLAIRQKVSNFTSPEMLSELSKVLRENFGQPEHFVESQVSLVAKYSRLAKPNRKVNVIKEDPKDDMVLECAASCKVNYIITGDNHILKLKKFENIAIVTPREILDLI